LPKRLQEYGAFQKELVLFAYSDRIEIWDKDTYDGLLTDEPEDFANLAEEVMGGNSDTNRDKSGGSDGVS
jgi:MraZ protein